MIDTWKTGTDCDKMEQLIKYKMHKQYHKSVFLKKKKKKASSNVKQFTVVLWLGAFKTPRCNWEIHTDWENDV